MSLCNNNVLKIFKSEIKSPDGYSSVGKVFWQEPKGHTFNPYILLWHQIK